MPIAEPNEFLAMNAVSDYALERETRPEIDILHEVAGLIAATEPVNKAGISSGYAEKDEHDEDQPDSVIFHFSSLSVVKSEAPTGVPAGAPKLLVWVNRAILPWQGSDRRLSPACKWIQPSAQALFENLNVFAFVFTCHKSPSFFFFLW